MRHGLATARLVSTLVCVATAGCADPPHAGLAQLEILRSEACRRSTTDRGPDFAVDCLTADAPAMVQLRDAIVAGRIEILADAFDACLVDGGRIVLDDRSLTNSDGAPTACADLFAGRLGRGSACTTDFECAGDSVCIRDEQVGCGTCEPRRELDAQCWHHNECETRNCNRESASCAAPDPAWVGEACAGRGCRDELDCLPAAPGQSSVCTPNRGFDDPCTTPEQCTSGFTCIAFRCKSGPEGSPCATDSNCPGPLVCAAGGECEYPLARGDYCEPGQRCPEGHACIEGVCGRWLGVGEQCSAPDLCPPAMPCTGGTCEWRPLLGEPCTDRCARGTCDGGRCRELPEGAACEVELGAGDPCGDLQTWCDGPTCRANPPAGERCVWSSPAPYGHYCADLELTPHCSL